MHTITHVQYVHACTHTHTPLPPLPYLSAVTCSVSSHTTKLFCCSSLTVSLKEASLSSALLLHAAASSFVDLRRDCRSS